MGRVGSKNQRPTLQMSLRVDLYSPPQCSLENLTSIEIKPSISIPTIPPIHPSTFTLANFIRSLAQQARNVPRLFPEILLSSNLAWTSEKDAHAQAGRSDRRADKMDQTPENKAEKQEKQERSYLSAAVESMTWASSRSSTPKPTPATLPGEGSGLKNQHGGYQNTPQWHGLSSKRYPSDCPPLNARWFHAVDVRLN